ncbi:AhpC/TSA family protein [Chryseobacterium soli]|uniref:TlpA disulfide reductase family protein n=1 Tax=Chryseobacterium soli TaxID=445961 RepID=UPI00295382FC|nr:TlpA disulfide reductase family protein [Chryseobacterium soli]MDV7698423.1 AhpC/TSA family protein [Chryseobacterium soli]
MKTNFIWLFFIVFLLTSCSQDKHQTILKGDIPNLPDGTLYVYENSPDNIIDSVNVKDGKFNLTHQWKSDKEPSYLGIDHTDKNGTKRLIDFPTHAQYRKAKWNTSLFLSDSIISISGNLIEEDLKDLKLPTKIKLVTIPKIIAGKQNQAYYNIDGDLFERIDNKTIQTIKEKIKQYPYSYHLLYKIQENKNSFSAEELKELLQLFNGNIRQSGTFKKLSVHNEKMFSGKKTVLPLLENAEGKRITILDPGYDKHLIVFWASWCGPCRQEIPMLKKLHAKKGTSVEFVSISIDSDKNAWIKALQTEKMDWKQVFINEKDPAYENLQIQFKLNGAIPYTVLVDNNLKILASSVGLSSEKDLYMLIEK